MKVTYDAVADAATIFFGPDEPGVSKKTIPMIIEGHDIIFDFGADGRLVFIEVLDASRVLPAEVLKTASRL